MGVPTESRNQALRSVNCSSQEQSAARPGQVPQSSRCGSAAGSKWLSTTPAAKPSSSVLEPAGVRGGVRRDLRLLGPLQEAVGDLDPLGAAAQPGERVDEPLGGVRLDGQLGRLAPLERVALVVDDQQPAGLGGVHVHDPVDEQAGPPAPGGASVKANGSSVRTRCAPAMRSRSSEPTKRSTMSRRSATSSAVRSRRAPRSGWPPRPRSGPRGGRSRAARAARARACRAGAAQAGLGQRASGERRLHAGQAQRLLEVEAVGAAPVVLEPAVGEPADRQRARRRQRAEPQLRLGVAAASTPARRARARGPPAAAARRRWPG